MLRYNLLLLSLLPLLVFAQTPMRVVSETDGIRICNLEPEGFVVLSKDSAAEEVLAFSEHGHFVADSMPPALCELIGLYEEEIAQNGSHVIRANAQPDLQSLAEGNIVVGPLLATHWAQTKYYNDKCPADSKGPGGHAYVGCGAIVMGQVIRYWQYPEHGKGSRSYTANYSKYGYGDYGTLSADFGNTYYDYANMPNRLTSKSTAAEVDAVSTLLYHCGVACGMKYGPSASTAYSGDMVSALTTYFRFKNSVEYIEKSSYTTAQWHQILQSELDSLAPFFYGASGSHGGHVFMCDGYRDDDYYHLNWGWDGQYDGWYKISAFNAGPYDFNDNHAAIIGIRGDHLPQAVDNVQEEVTPHVEKVFIDGHLYIIKDGKVYNLAGQLVNMEE